MRLCAVFAALVAVAIQAFVVQTHTHATPFAAAAIERATDHAGPGHTHVSAAHEQTGCITCIAFATAGASLAPGAATLTVALNATYEIAARAIRRAPRALTHSWRSRAPPTAL